MRVEKDYEEFLRSLNAHEVRYCIVGSYAVAFHARPRYTKDMDILVEPSAENAARLRRALEEFGFPVADLDARDLTSPGSIIQLGYEPVRIDILTSLPGVRFDQVWAKKVEGRYGAARVFFMGIDELILTKQHSSRAQDLADLEVLREIRHLRET